MTRRTSRLRSLTGLCLLASAVPLTLGPSGAAAAGAGSGRFATPFREDGAHYDAATHSFSGGFAKGSATDGNGCVTKSTPATGAPKGNPTAYDCLPAGASMVQLPDGKVLFWNALEGEEQVTGTNAVVLDGGRLTVNDESRVLDLRSGTPTYAEPSPVDAGAHQTTHPNDLPLGPFSAQHYSYNNGSMFCSDQVLLSNGDVIDVGGTDYYTEPYVPVVNKGVVELEGVKNSRIFDASAQKWALGPTMTYGRWYPGLVTLADGELLVTSGVGKLIKPVYPTSPADSGTNVKQSETLTLGSADPKWVVNPSSADKSLPLFPRLHLLPDGHVLYDAAGQDFNPAGQSYDEALWESASSYDPKSHSWSDLGVPGADAAYLAANPTAAPYVGFRGSTFSAALTMRPAKVTGDIPTYTSASFLTAGGVLGTSPGSYVAVANSRISTVDTSGGAETFSTVGTGDLNTPRWYGTATPLPNGQVYVSSGANVDEVDAPGSESPVLSTELFTPTVSATGVYTGGTWANVGDQARKRTYHNNAILQPDGSVLIGGHAPISTGYYQTTDTPDVPGRLGTNNHHDASFQVWQPPYFSDPARPVVDGVTASGRTLTVHTDDAAHIASVVLMRNTAQTHLVDGDGRTVALPVLSRAEHTVVVGLPSTTAVLPNGPYLLFANKSKTADLSGRDAAALLPSRAEQVYVTGRAVPTVFLPSAAQFHGSSVAAPTTVSRAITASARASRATVSAPAATTPALDLVARREHRPAGVPDGLTWLAIAALGLAVGGHLVRRRA
jgi:hypothetical protein